MTGRALVVGLVAALCAEGCDPKTTVTLPSETEGVNPACEVALPVDGHFAAPGGSPDGDGSLEHPWDLDTALRHPPEILPGDTLWLRGGTYYGSFVGKLHGEDGAPVTARSFPGEWARIDSRDSDQATLQIYHQWAIYRDFEVTNTTHRRYGNGRPTGIYVEGPQIKLVNLMIHDVGSGITCSSATADASEYAPELEIYGCLLYNNGWDDDDRAHGHHLYLGNRDGTKHILENLIFHAYGFGVHNYIETDCCYIEGYDLIGNVWFMNGVASAGESKRYDNCLVGGRQAVSRLLLRENFGWAEGADERNLRFGWSASGNQDVTLIDNYNVGQTVFQEDWQSITMTGNTFYGPLDGADPADHPDNTYLDVPPASPDVFVRLNAYQEGRAHIIVYNWDEAYSVDVDLGDALDPGTPYQIRNAQSYFAGPVVTGTYDGAPVPLPMTGLEPTQPVGSSGYITASERTGAAFNVFVLIANPCGR